MASPAKQAADKHGVHARVLRSKRAELLVHLREHRQEMLADQVPEDEGALASRTLMEHLTVGTLEREKEMLGEVEAALGRLAKGLYGICEACEADIPERRLRALPWARFCLGCAERYQATAQN